jgi:hypothetical protein
MKKILAAIATGVVGVVGVFCARAEGLLTPDVAADILFTAGYSTLALLLSWVLTAFAGSRHRAWAMGLAGGLMLLGGVVRWGLVVPVSYLGLTALLALASPFVFMVSEAALLAVGIQLRKGADGEVEGIKVGDDKTIFLDGGQPEDVERVVPKEGATVPKSGITPEPSNE